MIRNVDINELTDGKKYNLDSMVKIGTSGCNGCHTCCTGMGDSIILDPYDIYNLTKALDCSFEDLLKEAVSLSVVDGIILPHINMNNEKDCCHFLNDDNRCSIHESRPGFCRLFPLGRLYNEDGSFEYIVQIHECPYKDKTKVKIKNWLSVPEIKKYEAFISDWRNYLHSLREKASSVSDETYIKNLNMNLLTRFFLASYNKNEDFYTQFYDRL